MQVIFSNFPYSDPTITRNSHIWNYDNLRPLTWEILKNYIASQTQIPLEFIRVKNIKRTMAPFMNVGNLENVTYDINSHRKIWIDKYSSKYSHDYWFEMRLSMFENNTTVERVYKND